MLYLEDYLEMIEHLPQELRDRFTEMREMDLQVHNSMDSLDERVKNFFQNAKKLPTTERDAEYEKIRQDYYKALEDGDEKVNIANQVHDLVERYSRRLDQELQKFKMELEADNAGITEILEQRSLELDNPSPIMNSISLNNNHKIEKRKHGQQNISVTYTPGKQVGSEKVFSSIASDAMRETITNNRSQPPGHSPSSSSTSSSSSSSSTAERPIVLPPQSKNHPFGGGNALAAAASQAIAATQQSLKRSSSQNQSNLVQQGRRTASLKASYEAVNSGQTLGKEFTLGNREINSVSSTSPTISNNATVPNESKIKINKKARTSQVTTTTPTPSSETSSFMEDSEDSSLIDENSNVDWTFDPNEPRYCMCNQVSYGDMVACDNKDCPFEWFHYQCVGITQPPKGKWFCPQCTASMKRRGRKDKQ